MKNEDLLIPIVIGVSGHRNLNKEYDAQIKKVVKEEIVKIQKQFPNSPILMLNSLAAGADCLCAQVALDLNISLVCPLPFETGEYEKDFNEEELVLYQQLLAKATKVFTVANLSKGRDEAYLKAGLYVSEHCHVLLALWDGDSNQKQGVGTASIVDKHLNGVKNENYFDSAYGNSVIHIKVPRANQTISEIEIKYLYSEETNDLNHLKQIDEFNKDCLNLKLANPYNLIDDESLNKCDERVQKLNQVYLKADKLAQVYQQKYLKMIKVYAVFGILLVLFLLLYDELECPPFLILYGILLAIYLLSFVFSKNKTTHQKYMNYRMLAENLRSEFYLTAAGINVNIGNYFTFTQKRESCWITKVLYALLIGEKFKNQIELEQVKQAWIVDQLHYHKLSINKNKNKIKVSAQTTLAMVIASIVLFVVVLVFEYCLDSFMLIEVSLGLWMVNMRTILKISLGLVSAIAAFVGNYYGKLSLERKEEDNHKMIHLYSLALKALDDDCADYQSLFVQLAKEEIVENANWYSYIKDNTISINL